MLFETKQLYFRLKNLVLVSVNNELYYNEAYRLPFGWHSKRISHGRYVIYLQIERPLHFQGKETEELWLVGNFDLR